MLNALACVPHHSASYGAKHEYDSFTAETCFVLTNAAGQLQTLLFSPVAAILVKCGKIHDSIGRMPK